MIPDNILKDLNLEWEIYPKRPVGGQTCGVFGKGVRLICRDIGFEFATDFGRSQLANKDLAFLMLEFFLIENKII